MLVKSNATVRKYISDKDGYFPRQPDEYHVLQKRFLKNLKNQTCTTEVAWELTIKNVTASFNGLQQTIRTIVPST